MLCNPAVRLLQSSKPIFSVRYFHKHGSNKYRIFNSLRRYILTNYTQYVSNYEKVFEKRFPSAFHVYRVFKIGLTDFYVDLKGLMRIFRQLTLREEKLSTLPRKDLEIYMKMPKDMRKVAPVLLLSALPFANYVVFPLAYYFPKQLLSSHFWSLQQRTQFAVTDQRTRLKHNKPVFRALQAQMRNLKTSSLFIEWRECVALLGSGQHPSPDLIKTVAPLFFQYPYNIPSLASNHVFELLRIHNLHPGWRRRRRLTDHGRMIQLLDAAILREGGVASLTSDEIRNACFMRGLNPTSVNVEETVMWLNQWLSLSECFTQHDHVSLILHLPILTAYNHPSNWVLIH